MLPRAGAAGRACPAGCLSFLREFHNEARIVAGIPQLIADLGLATAAPAVTADAVVGATLQDLGTTGRQVATALLQGLATVDELVAATDLPVAAVLASLASSRVVGSSPVSTVGTVRTAPCSANGSRPRSAERLAGRPAVAGSGERVLP
jgi:hypothetical protein